VSVLANRSFVFIHAIEGHHRITRKLLVHDLRPLVVVNDNNKQNSFSFLQVIVNKNVVGIMVRRYRER
jgi:hypothetical protein